MNTLLSEAQPHADSVTPAIAVQVTQAGVPTGHFPLAEGKSTVGSSPSCQIRLHGSDVRPLHCLIVRRGHDITVTRWAAGIQHNGLDFATTSLQADDVLSIGDVRLQLINTAGLASHEPLPDQSPVALIDEVEAQVAAEFSDIAVAPPVTESTTTPPSLPELDRLRTANKQARERFRRLMAVVRELRYESRGLDQQVCGLTEQLHHAQQAQERLAADLHQAELVATERESQYAEELDRAIAELTATYSRVDAAQRELDELRAGNQQLQHQIDSLSAELDQARQSYSDYQAETQHLEQELSAREAELTCLRAEVDQLQHALQTSVEELEHQNATLQHQLAAAHNDRERELAELRQALETSITELAEQNEGLCSQLATVSSNHERELTELREGLEASIVELHGQNEDLRNQLAALSADRDHQLFELHTRNDALRVELASVTADRDREVQSLRECIDESTEELQSQKDQLAAQITAIAAERDERVAELQHELEEARQAALDKGKLAQQVTDAEHRCHLLEIDVRSINAEWQQSQSTVARLQDELLTAEARAADLDAKLTDFQLMAELELHADCDQLTGELAAARQQLQEHEQALTDSRANSDQLQAQLEATQQELAANQLNLTELAGQLAQLESTAAALEEERSRLTATLADREEQVCDLNRQLDAVQNETARQLAARDEQVAQLTAELESTRTSLGCTADASAARIAELTTALEHLETTLGVEVQTKNERINELTTQLADHSAKLTEDVGARDVRIVELTDEIARLAEASNVETTTLQQEIDALKSRLLTTEDKSLLEISRRDERITELARELHNAQDQLAECTAQSERLSELYRQAQADLAALNTAQAVGPTGGSDSSQPDILEQHSLEDRANTVGVDPRDDDEPRLERALAGLASAADSSDCAAPYQPTSFIDRYSHIFDESAPAGSTGLETRENGTQPHSELDEIASDDSAALETYMANMMKRVRGEISSDTITPPVPREPSGETFGNPVSRMHALTQRVAAPVEITPPDDEGDRLIDLDALRQSSQKPPLPTNLLAMRELANASARQAIAKHRKRRHFEGALSKILVSGIAGGTSAAMLLTADDYLSPYFLAGCGVAVVSAYWGLKLCGILLEMIRDGVNNDRSPAELTETEDQLPIDGVTV